MLITEESGKGNELTYVDAFFLLLRDRFDFNGWAASDGNGLMEFLIGHQILDGG